MALIQRLIRYRYRISPETVLNANAGRPAGRGSPDPGRLATLLRALKMQAARAAGRDLDYDAMASSEAYASYRQYVRQLPFLEPERLSSVRERLAFWINLYNALIMDAVIQWRVRRSVREIPGFFWRAAYNIGGQRISANDIEHGILRANSPHPAFPGRPFGRDDRRRAYALPQVDPRVHFTLVCASRSCPPVAVYTPERVNEQLDLATGSFVRGGGVEIEAEPGRVRLSRLFRWYAPDFGAPPLALGDRRPLLRFIARYLDDPAERQLLLRGHPRVVFMPYDWSLNGRWGAIR